MRFFSIFHIQLSIYFSLLFFRWLQDSFPSLLTLRKAPNCAWLVSYYSWTLNPTLQHCRLSRISWNGRSPAPSQAPAVTKWLHTFFRIYRLSPTTTTFWQRKGDVLISWQFKTVFIQNLLLPNFMQRKRTDTKALTYSCDSCVLWLANENTRVLKI